MLGAELRVIRERQSLTLRSLATMTGLSPEAISSVERGGRYPSLRTLECLAEGLHIFIIIGPVDTTLEIEH